MLESVVTLFVEHMHAIDLTTVDDPPMMGRAVVPGRAGHLFHIFLFGACTVHRTGSCMSRLDRDPQVSKRDGEPVGFMTAAGGELRTKVNPRDSGENVVIKRVG